MNDEAKIKIILIAVIGIIALTSMFLKVNGETLILILSLLGAIGGYSAVKNSMNLKERN